MKSDNKRNIEGYNRTMNEVKKQFLDQQKELKELREKKFKYERFINACRFLSSEMAGEAKREASELLGLPAGDVTGQDVSSDEKLTCPFCKQKKKFLLQFPLAIRVHDGDMMLRDGVGVDRSGMNKEICFSCLEAEADALY